MLSNLNTQAIIKRKEVLTLCTFFCLYIAQAVPQNFLTTALQVIMRQGHYTLTTISMLQFVKLPWILKFLWAPVVDRRCTSLKGFKHCIIAAELTYALALIAAGLLDVGSQMPLILLLVVTALFASATQDIATDALAVLTYQGRDKSMVNTIQSMGSFAGVLVGCGLLLMMLHAFGWRIVVVCLALFVVVALLPLIFNRHLSVPAKTESQEVRLNDFALFFCNRGVWRQVLFLLLFYTGLIGILAILRPYLVDMGYNMKEIGFLSGIVGSSSAFLFSFCSGFLIRRIGIQRARISYATLMVLTAATFVVMTYLPPMRWLVIVCICLLWGVYGGATIVVYTSAMNCVRLGREGTDFTVQTVITHLGSMVAAMMSGPIADAIGYRGLFAVEVALAVVTLTYVTVAFRKS